MTGPLLTTCDTPAASVSLLGAVRLPAHDLVCIMQVLYHWATPLTFLGDVAEGGTPTSVFFMTAVEVMANFLPRVWL